MGRRLYRMNRIAAKEIADKDTHNISSTLGVTILVVDDKPNIIKQLSDIFQRSEWVVKSASDEASALRACETALFSYSYQHGFAQ